MAQNLNDKLDTLSEMGFLPKEMPIFVTNNLKSSFSIRPYQVEGFSRFFYYLKDYPQRQKPVHLLFNMATGSGKTYMMAGSILYLYSLGYRKFLFFVNSKNIIAKTKENFLEVSSNKYLFAEKIVFSGKQVQVQEVENFSRDDGDDIEIKFTTIHALHTDMNEVREGRLSYEEFEEKKIVMISDEAHHINTLTKSKLDKTEQEEKKSWENTVTKILGMHRENILLEYTATLDDKNPSIVEKYADKLIYKYDLKVFRAEWWSKEIDIIKADLSQDERVLQALILSQYRLKIAEKHRIRCKPVILFKAQKEVEESKENERQFHILLENLSPNSLESLRNKTEVEIAKKALDYLKDTIGYDGLIRELREDFKKENCLNVNDKINLDNKNIDKKLLNEALSQSAILNTLEDKNNPVRAIFAVQKLNEWWDVLNLFDIVRMYDTRDGDEKNWVYSPGKGTIAEAQLIGRWARYFPFSYESYIGEDRYKRKFDKVEHELRILETFYYHTFYNVRYISEIKQALRSIGMMDEETKSFTLKLKESFKESDLYQNGVVYTNERREKSRADNDRLEQVGIKTRQIEYIIATGRGGDEMVFGESTWADELTTNLKRESLSVSQIDSRIVRKALSQNVFYTFHNLKSHLWKLESMEDFITNPNFLGSCSIQYASKAENIEKLKAWKLPTEILKGLSKLLRILETEISMREVEYEATWYSPKSVQSIFEEKTIQIPLTKDEKTVSGDWYAFEKFVGTPEEEGLIECMDKMVEELKRKYEVLYLLRNERHFPIYSFNWWERFEPDFVLFLQEKNSNERFTYQVFIEPKWDGYKATDQWKEDFLLQIETKAEILDMNIWNYRLLGLPFYSISEEQDFISKTKTKLL